MLKLLTLGRVAVLVNEKPVHIGERKQQALLVYLAAHAGQGLDRRDVATLLWSASNLSRARHSLSQAIYRIRSRIPSIDLVCDGDRLLLPCESVTADFTMFREAVEELRFHDAVDLYSGDFLQDFWVPKAPSFEEWQETERASFRQSAIHALREVLDVEESRGNWLEVERIAAQMLLVDPYLEDAHRARIQAIAAGGDRLRALRVWREVETMFIRDLSRAPDELAAAVRPLVEMEGTSSQLSTSGDKHFDVPFVGRGQEFGVLRTEWECVQAGHGRMVVVAGEAGIGKSRLCTRFLRLAAIQGARCFDGRCYSTESVVPYSGITDALSSGIRRTDFLGLHDQWKNTLSGLLPQLVTRDQKDVVVEADSTRRRLFEAFVQLVIHISTKCPVVLFIDDFHWADDSTIALVHFLARRLSDHPVLILVALRWENTSGDSALRKFMASVDGLNAGISVRLSDMPVHEVRELIRLFNTRHDICLPFIGEERLIRRVGGRPFFVIEYLRAYQQDSRILETDQSISGFNAPKNIPASIKRKLAARFESLEEPAVRIVGALAVLGRGVPLNVLCRIAGVTDIEAMHGLAALIETGTLVESADEISFSHPIVREAAYQWIGGPRRRVLHARAAEVLRDTGGSAEGTLAVHYDLAGCRQEAFAHAISAANLSEKLHSVVEAEYFLRMALANAESESERHVARERLAQFLYGCRRHAEAEEHFAKLEPVYKANEDENGLLLTEVNKVAAARRRGSLASEEAVGRLQLSVEVADRKGDEVLLGEILGRLVDAAHDAGDRDLILKVAERLVDLSGRIGRSGESVRYLCVAATVIGIYLNLERGLSINQKAVERAQRMNQPEVYLLALRTRATLRFLVGMVDSAREDLVEARSMVDRVGNESASFELSNTRALIELECGNYSQAAEQFDNLVRLALDRHIRHDLLIANANLMVLEFERGDLDRARELAEQILDWNRTISVWWCNITAWGVLGHCALRRGDFAEANRCRRELMLLYEGRDFLVLDVSYAEGFLARLATIDGDADKALERLDDAIAAYEGRDVFCRARLQLERARALLELDVAEARRQAEEVKEFGGRIGAQPLVRKAEEVLALA